MRVKLRTEPRGDYENIDVMTGTSVKEIADDLADRLPYTVIAAKVDNHIEDLDFVLEEPCKVELLDIRTQAANLIYQYSLSLIYLKAVKDTLGDDVRVEIQNSLNKGLYTEIKTKEPVTEEQVQAVENRMRELVDADLPFIKTGYIKYFQLMKYRRGVLLRFPHPSAPDRIPEYVDEVKLYQAFGEQTRWDALLGVNYVADLNDKIESGEYKELIQLSEALHEKKIAEIADMIKTQKKRLVLIAGPSSSGKTTFARRLCIQLRVNGLRPLYMGTDDYFVEREDTPLDEKGEKDFENLDALDIDLFNRNMNDLLAGKKVDLPEFDFMTGHKVFGKRITSIDRSQPIVMEGIHGLNGKLTEFIPDDEKFKIYISPLTQLNIDMHNRIPTTDERMLRRMVRDYLYRGHSAQSTINQWPKVRTGEDKNIFPYSSEADVLFNSYHVYEISVLKKYAEPLLRRIAPDEEEYAEAVRMLKFLRFFRTIEDDSIIVNNSIIREFIGGSIFVD